MIMTEEEIKFRRLFHEFYEDVLEKMMEYEKDIPGLIKSYQAFMVPFMEFPFYRALSKYKKFVEKKHGT